MRGKNYEVMNTVGGLSDAQLFYNNLYFNMFEEKHFQSVHVT